MKKNLRPYWRRNGWEASRPAAGLGTERRLQKRCAAFDARN
jgi:hypothetical protein